ncbi:LPS export ABC transporter periplasmic protein LptC [bacterium]|nr:LPS export ABC transporter periplasmic protein LptC [bacterium]
MKFKILFLMFLCSCQKMEEPFSKIDVGEKPDQKIWKAEISVFDKNELRTKVLASELLRLEESDKVLANGGIQIDIFEQGKHTTTINADSGEVSNRTKDINAFGNVAVESDSGVTVLTQEIHWQFSRKRIFTNLNVTVITKYDTLYGTGFESDSKLENWTILNPFGVSSRKIDRKNL